MQGNKALLPPALSLKPCFHITHPECQTRALLRSARALLSVNGKTHCYQTPVLFTMLGFTAAGSGATVSSVHAVVDESSAHVLRP